MIFIGYGLSIIESNISLRDSDLLWCLLRRSLREDDRQNTVFHGSLNFLVLQGHSSVHTPIPKCAAQCEHTSTPLGRGIERENLPDRRSRTTYPFSLLPEDVRDSPNTVSVLLWISMLTFSLLRPGSSNVAVTRFFSLSSWTSIL